MTAFRKLFTGAADAIITNAIIMAGCEIKEGEQLPPYHYTDAAAWDTGAQFTFISPRIVKALNLSPCNEGVIMGIGGDAKVKTYKINLGLPNGYLISNLEVYCSDIDDYDVLIGMDIITLTDFCISNQDGNTLFSFNLPAKGNIAL